MFIKEFPFTAWLTENTCSEFQWDVYDKENPNRREFSRKGKSLTKELERFDRIHGGDWRYTNPENVKTSVLKAIDAPYEKPPQAPMRHL
jgi:hypothetical protein